jgi:hypothetical protein
MPAHPLDPDDPTTTVLSLRLPAKVAQRLKDEAQRAGESLSATVRRLLDGKADVKTDVYTHKAEPKTTPADDQALAASLAAFPEKSSRLRIENAIRLHKARLDKQFMFAVSEKAQRVIAESNDFVRKRLKEVEAELRYFEQERGKKGVFTPAGYTLLLMCVHPDNSACTAVRNRLLDIVVRNEKHLIKGDVVVFEKPKPKPKKK